MYRVTSRGFLVGVIVALTTGVGAAHAATPFGLTCTTDPDPANGGVRECVGSTATRVLSFDNLPLDVNVVLPATGDSKLPLITLMHGYGGKKQAADDKLGSDAVQLGTMVSYAKRGYAVLSFTARGFGESCGSASSRLMSVSLGPAAAEACQKGWIHLDDMRYEARDAQWLMGLLVDQGFADPQRLGVSGDSYGGITSIQLAVLKDRMWVFAAGADPDTATLVPFTSKGGIPMKIAAAGPSIPGSDLAYSLVPNGRTTDFQLLDRKDGISPAGVPKLSYVTGFYGTGSTTGGGFYAPPGADRHADINNWYARIVAGDPYDEPVAQGILEEISRWHSGYALLSADAPQPLVAPAPTLLGNGFTDDLFPVDEAMRFSNKVKALFPGTPVSTFFADYGHARGQNKADDLAKLRAAYAAWFDHYVKGEGPVPTPGATALTQTCPKTAASEGPYTAATYDALHPGEIRSRFGPSVMIASTGGNPNVARATDPIVVGSACAITDAADQPAPAAATYRLPKVTGSYTLLGAPTVIAKITKNDTMNAQLAARLWDVGADGKQTLVARTLYRPQGTGKTEVFQLHANGYRFASGNTPKLELLGSDAPYGRQPSGGAFTITVSDLEIRLPVHDTPDCVQVLSHAPPFTAGKALAPDIAAEGTGNCGRSTQAGSTTAGLPASQTSVGGSSPTVNGIALTASGKPKPKTTHRVALRLRCRNGHPQMRIIGTDRSRVRRAVFFIGVKKAGTDRRSPFTARVPLSKAKPSIRLKAVVTFKDRVKRTVRVRSHACRPARR